MIKIMITKPKKTPDHLVMIIQLMNIFMTCKDCGSSENRLGGEPFVLFVGLVWVTSISST